MVTLSNWVRLQFKENTSEVTIQGPALGALAKPWGVLAKVSLADWLLLLVFQDNRELACSDQVCPLLLTLFDPREQCSAVQVLATKVFVKLVHVLHVSVEEVSREGAGVSTPSSLFPSHLPLRIRSVWTQP